MVKVDSGFRERVAAGGPKVFGVVVFNNHNSLIVRVITIIMVIIITIVRVIITIITMIKT